MSTPVMHDKHTVSEVQVLHGYWQSEQADPVRKVPDGQLVTHPEDDTNR